MSKKSIGLEVPFYIRDELMPFADIFESVIIPMARKVPLSKIDQMEITRLKKEITRHQIRAGYRQHYALVYYGLMICCRYCERECFIGIDVKAKTRN